MTPAEQAMAQNGPPNAGAAAEFAKLEVPEPKRTEPLITYQDWYVPTSGDTSYDQVVRGNVTFNERGNGMGVQKLPMAQGMWLLRKITGAADFRYTLRVTIPNFSRIAAGFDRETQLAVGIYPFEKVGGVSSVLPGPLHHAPRDVEFVATRIAGKVTTTLDGQPLGAEVDMPGDAIMGVYSHGCIDFSFYDFVTDDVSTEPGMTEVDLAKRSPQEILAACEKSILRIETVSNEGKGAGTGFLVDGDGSFITSEYVLSNVTSATATLSDGTVCDVLGRLATDHARDIVIGKLALSARPTLKLVSQPPRKGDQIIVLGAPLGATITATQGVVSGIRTGNEMPADSQGMRTSGRWIQFDAAVTKGHCGSPILNSAGEVVAMTSLVSSPEVQNVNLGISAEDLQQMLTKSRFRGISPLATSNIPLGPKRETAIGAAAYENALKVYVTRCQQEYSLLNRELKDAIDAVTALIRDFEKGQTQIPPNIDTDADMILQAGPQGKPAWMFRNADVKKRQIKRMQDQLRSLTRIRKQLSGPNNPESVLQLSAHYGAKLYLHNDKSVGFLTGAKVIEALSKNELAILVDSQPCVIWLESTKGFDAGEQFEPQAVYLDGTKTVNVRNLSTPTVQLLRPVSEKDLRTAIEAVMPGDHTDDKPVDDPAREATAAQPKAAPFRTWSDKTGKFQIEAQLESFDGKFVKLKRRDGTVVSVPVEKLSEADRKQLPK